VTHLGRFFDEGSVGYQGRQVIEYIGDVFGYANRHVVEVAYRALQFPFFSEQWNAVVALYAPAFGVKCNTAIL